MSTSELVGYFAVEKQGAALIAALGAVSVVLTAYLWLSAHEFHRRMSQANVRCVQEPKEIFGARVAQYLDPDGLAISVGEERRG